MVGINGVGKNFCKYTSNEWILQVIITVKNMENTFSWVHLFGIQEYMREFCPSLLISHQSVGELSFHRIWPGRMILKPLLYGQVK